MAPASAPPRPLTQGNWRNHHGCEWTWQIQAPGTPDTAVCVAHSVEFVLPTPDEAYNL